MGGRAARAGAAPEPTAARLAYSAPDGAVAKLLEERFPDVVNTQPELLAHHYTEANCPAEAIAYWLKAGAAAAKQSANVEAINQFGKGLELVAALPGPRERAEQELDLQMALGPARLRPSSAATPTLTEPMRGPGNSVSNSGMTHGGSQHSVA
jgi:hypothetical protein